MDAQDTTQSHEAQSPGTGAQAREGVRARATAIRAFRCKNLIVVIERET
ncbi:hypothetical protein [Oceanicella sp. SM1341]|nr:hypothetical protein [Oceanicella sp. SM1341]